MNAVSTVFWTGSFLNAYPQNMIHVDCIDQSIFLPCDVALPLPCLQPHSKMLLEPVHRLANDEPQKDWMRVENQFSMMEVLWYLEKLSPRVSCSSRISPKQSSQRLKISEDNRCSTSWQLVETKQAIPMAVNLRFWWSDMLSNYAIAEINSLPGN